jgi:hypothetical protein
MFLIPVYIHAPEEYTAPEQINTGGQLLQVSSLALLIEHLYNCFKCPWTKKNY